MTDWVGFKVASCIQIMAETHLSEIIIIGRSKEPEPIEPASRIASGVKEIQREDVCL